MCSDHIQRQAENRVKYTVSLENNQKKVIDVGKSAQQLTETIEESHSKVDRNRVGLAEVQIEAEKERWLKNYCLSCFLVDLIFLGVEID